MGKSVHDYYRQAWLKLSAAPETAEPAGPVIEGPEALRAAFQCDWESGRIHAARYRCSCCVTLIALCEHLAELAGGKDLAQAAGLDEPELLGAHPEIPDSRRNRAALAIAAFQAALISTEGSSR